MYQPTGSVGWSNSFTLSRSLFFPFPGIEYHTGHLMPFPRKLFVSQALSFSASPSFKFQRSQLLFQQQHFLGGGGCHFSYYIQQISLLRYHAIVQQQYMTALYLVQAYWYTCHNHETVFPQYEQVEICLKISAISIEFEDLCYQQNSDLPCIIGVLHKEI